MKTMVRPSGKKLPQPAANPKFWLGLNLHRLRKHKRLTQEELAKAAGMSARRLRDIENAVPESNPELDTLLGLARVLGVPVGRLFEPLPDSELPEV